MWHIILSWKYLTKKELEQIALNHLSGNDFKDVMRLYKYYAKEPYSFLVNDRNFLLDNPLRFRKSLIKHDC